MMTGMDAKRAMFQALSAFSGTGFTTKEAEYVVNHPLRRKIITWLMILGNAGIVTVIITATSSLVTSKGYHLPVNAFLLVAGLYLIYKIATRTGLTRRWESFVENKLLRSSTFEEGVTEDLLHLIEGYGLVRTIIAKESPWANNSLLQLKLSQKGLLVLGIERGKHWISVPSAKEIIKEDDKLVVYGPLNILRDLFKKESGA